VFRYITEVINPVRGAVHPAIPGRQHMLIVNAIIYAELKMVFTNSTALTAFYLIIKI
jgi:hypothetical protein